MNSFRLILFGAIFCLGFAAFAQQTAPLFSDNESPTFENTYLIDNIGTNSKGADLTLRIHKSAPFGECKDKANCPASVIVSGATGNVNMPVDVNVRSLHVSKNPVIDASGKWVGPPTGLIGPKGEKGDPGIPGAKGDKGDTGPEGPRGERGFDGPMGPIGPKGDKGDPGIQGPSGEKGEAGSPGPRGERGERGPEGAMGPIGLKGDKGDKGDSGKPGEGCWFDDQKQRINCGETWIEIGNLKGPKGDSGPAGSKGDKGDKGDAGKPGEGCWYDDQMQRINCAGGTWIPISLLRGPQGETGPMGPAGPKGNTGPVGPQGPKGTLGSCRKVSAETTLLSMAEVSASCDEGEILAGGGCYVSNGMGHQLQSSVPILEEGTFYCEWIWKSGVSPQAKGQAFATCCK